MANWTERTAMALLEIGRPNDARLQALALGQYSNELYEDLNRVHERASLNSAASSQTVNLTAVHPGTFLVPQNYRATRRIRMVEPAVADSFWDLRRRDYFVAEQLYPPGTPRGTPEVWSWARDAYSENYVAMGFTTVVNRPLTLQVWPQPDRVLNLTHTFHVWLVSPGSTGDDEVLRRWGGMCHNFLCARLLSSIGEEADAQRYWSLYERDKAAFRDWDAGLAEDEELTMESTSRSGRTMRPMLG